MIAIENELNGCNNDGKLVGKYLAIDTTKWLTRFVNLERLVSKSSEIFKNQMNKGE